MDFTIALDNHSTLPLHRQLYEELRRLILSGKLQPGGRLPSTRGLAKSLGISRATVTQSYEQLLSEGYLQAVTGSGTFVCDCLPDDLLSTSLPDGNTPMPAQPLVQLSSYGNNLLKTDYLVPLSNAESSNQNLISFRYGAPALDEIPLKQWRQLLSRHCRVTNREMFDYTNDTRGYLPLREAIARYLVQSRAVQCEADQVIIVSGSQQAIELVTRILIERGDKVALENPSYLDAQRIFLSNGAKLLPVPVDASGIIVERLLDYSTATIKLIYVTPSHQFPTGAVMSLSRRVELLAWATQTGAMIIEDDYDSEFRYTGRPIPALQGLDQGKVIYVGTFSKVLFPALRIGYLVVPKSLVSVVAHAKRLTDRQSPMLEQQVLTDFINEGDLERHIRRMRKLYDHRRQVLIQALRENLGDRVTILGENAGIHLMVRLHSNLSDEDVITSAAQLGVELVTAQRYYLEGNGTSEFVLGYSNLSEEKIQEGVYRLAQALGYLEVKINDNY
jgi:GntR family transcriptional regulator/MocR family aminotransferase